MKYGVELFRHIPVASNKKIEFFSCICKIKKLLPPYLAAGVKSAYIKNDTLFFLLENKSLEFEANYKLNALASILKEFCAFTPECKEVVFSKIKAYSRAEAPKPPLETTFLEKERSCGKFENKFTNKELQEKLEQIRALIIKNTSKA